MNSMADDPQAQQAGVARKKIKRNTGQLLDPSQRKSFIKRRGQPIQKSVGPLRYLRHFIAHRCAPVDTTYLRSW